MLNLALNSNKRETEKYRTFTTAPKFLPRKSKGHPWSPVRENRKPAMSTGGVIVPVRPHATREQKGDFEGCDRTFRTVQLIFKILRKEMMPQTQKEQTESISTLGQNREQGCFLPKAGAGMGRNYFKEI